MRKKLCWKLILALALLLCACTAAGTADHAPALPTDEIPATQTTAGATDAPATETLETVQEETEASVAAHSALYLPQYTTQQILEYFSEVVLHMEYTSGDGDPALVQKWKNPIRYQIYGTPTDEDISVLTDFFAQLNEIPGFPGIYAATDENLCDLTIGFLEPEAFRDSFSFLNGEDANGAVQFWYYTDSNEIHTASIGYRTDIDQITRSSILIEEVVNMLGISDTLLRPDSIVYQYSDDNFTPSDVDWIILKLLYDPSIQCGMNYDSCRTIIEALYY